AGYGRLDLIARENLKGKVEFFRKLVLPLLDETARGDNETAFQIAADQQLLDEQTGHDRLAGAGVVGEQKPERLARQHFAIDRRDLMGQGLDQRGADGEIGIEKMGEADAVSLGGKLEQRSVGAETVGSTALDNLQKRLFAPIE